jgi:hypothetical protein
LDGDTVEFGDLPECERSVDKGQHFSHVGIQRLKFVVETTLAGQGVSIQGL